MKITAAKVKKELIAKYKWENLEDETQKYFTNALIKDTISVINDILMYQKNISIKK